MEIKCTETVCDCLRLIVSETLRREEEREAVVTDSMPDISAILSVSGTPLIRSKDLSAGQLRLAANLPIRVAYLPENGDAICTLELDLPVSVTLENAEISEACTALTGLVLVSLEARILNPRKIAVRAEFCFPVRVYCASPLRFFGAPEEAGQGIHVLEREAEITPVCAALEKTFVLTDEAPLASDSPAVAKILSQSTVLETEELKSVGTKIILKGSAVSRIVYLSTDGTPAAASFRTAFSQIAEADRLPADCLLSCEAMLSGAYYEPGSPDGGTIRAEMHVVAELTVRNRQSVRYLADAYNNLWEMETAAEARELERAVREMRLGPSARAAVETPAPVYEVLSVSASPGEAAVEGGTVTLPLTAQIFYFTGDGAVRCAVRTIPVKATTDLEEGARLIVTGCALRDCAAVPAGGGLDLRAETEIAVSVLMTERAEMISAITVDEERPLDLTGEPTLVLLRAEGDDLWPLARAYHSEVEAIRPAASEEAAEGEGCALLLIPKTLS